MKVLKFADSSQPYGGKIALKLSENPATYTVYVKMYPKDIKPYHCSNHATPKIRKHLVEEIDVDVNSPLWPGVEEALKELHRPK